MAVYSWRGRNNRGEAVTGELEALTEGGVADQLLSIGVSPVHIALAEVKEDKPAGSTLAWLSRKPVVVEDLLIFSRQMYTLNKAGVPILRAFAGLEASATKPAMVDLLKDIRASLDQGRELSAALARHSDLFGGFYISMIRVGEMTGRLTEVFLRLTEHMEFERDVRERIKQATRYPTFVMIAMAVAIVILNVFVIPVFAKVFAGFNTQLPLITRGLLGFSNWMINWWPLLLALTIAAVVGVRAYLRTPEGRYRWDARKLKLPIVGDIIQKATLARFARSFALSSQSGVPLVQALTVVAQTVDNAFIGSRIEQMRDGIERGESISRCAAATGVFTPVVLQMINVGEETGELDNLLFEIAMYERDTDYSIKGLSASIEPILLAVIGVLVLLLALGVFLPLWNMGQAAMGRGGGWAVAALRPAPRPSPVWDTRLAQWGLVLLLVIVLGGTMAYQLRAVQGQAELAQIKSTLGALRTALVVAHLQAAVAGTPGSAQIVAPVQRNPFAALQQLPANYAGVADPQALAAMPGGNWVFDPACPCIGYHPMEADRLEAPKDAVALWFRVVGSGGVLQLSAQQPYVWMGQRVD